MELLDLQVAETAGEAPRDVFGLPNALERRPLFPGQPAAELERGGEPGGFGGTDAFGAKPFGSGPLRKPAQGTLAELQQAAGHLQDAAAAPSGADDDGEQLGCREGGGPEGPEPLAPAGRGGEGGPGAGPCTG